jgi:hypothetical protein
MTKPEPKLDPKLAQLSDAFSWELGQLDNWQKETMKNFGPGEQNEVKKLLNAAWYLYLGQLQDANKRVVQICEQLKNNGLDKKTAIYYIREAIDDNRECSDVKQGIDDYLDSIGP